MLCGLQTFSFVEQGTVRKHARHDGLSVDTVMRYLRNLTVLVERKVSAALPYKFSIFFYGWYDGYTQYIAMFEIFPSDSRNGFNKILLDVSPSQDETLLGLAEHLDFFDFVLGICKKERKQIVPLVGDSGTTNKEFANLSGNPLVGCPSHRFNHTGNGILAGDSDVIEAI